MKSPRDGVVHADFDGAPHRKGITGHAPVLLFLQDGVGLAGMVFGAMGSQEAVTAQPES